MPYIKQQDRGQYNDLINKVVEALSVETAEDGTQTKRDFSVGEVNYVISSIIWKLFSNKKSYTVGNNLVGVLECVKQEFVRRQLSPYEDQKIAENGDI